MYNGEPRVAKDKLQLLRQALSAASTSLKLANQLLNDVEHQGGAASMPGLVGKYDGRFMVTEAGKKYPVPDNYAAKTQLIYGDTLKMVEGPLGRQFKLLEKLTRVEEEAQLGQKDGMFVALGKTASYELLQGAVRYWGGQEGDKIKVFLPDGKKNVPFAGLLEIAGRKPGEGLTEDRHPVIAKPEPTKKEPIKEKEAPAPEKKEIKEVKKEPEAKNPPAKAAAPKKAVEKKEEAKPAAKEKPASRSEKLEDEDLR
ncbi:MAG: hypothetical protein WEC39_00750 [Patescibacteria group bacterium]